MEQFNCEVRELALNRMEDAAAFSALLRARGLNAGEPLEYAAGVFCGERLTCVGGYQGAVLKCFAVDPDYEGEGLLGMLISHILNRLHAAGRHRLFVFTKPGTADLFTSFGFLPVSDVPGEVVLLDNHRYGVEGYCDSIRDPRARGIVGSIVMNCNPFTRGHEYLVRYAAEHCDFLYVFVLDSDRTYFPAPVRLQLAREVTAEMPHVAVVPGGPYLISEATFPSYFLKDEGLIVDVQLKLDLNIFARRLAPQLGIVRRFVGEEPFCRVTRRYNHWMKEILPPLGVELIEIPRICDSGEAISASRVRQLFEQGDYAALGRLVPEPTSTYLVRLGSNRHETGAAGCCGIA